jgi:hypothetical protein
MNVPTRRKRRAGILPASFVAAGREPALLFQFAILALAITWTGLVAPFCFAQSATAQEKTAATTIPPPPAQSLPRQDFHCLGNVGRTYLDSDLLQFPQPDYVAAS